ncbi:MAG: hypothetical protein HFJ29_00990 [Clostridia bacterium]|nr:hypothetical protein [Clostridia bacterium]
MIFVVTLEELIGLVIITLCIILSVTYFIIEMIKDKIYEKKKKGKNKHYWRKHV